MPEVRYPWVFKHATDGVCRVYGRCIYRTDTDTGCDSTFGQGPTLYLLPTDLSFQLDIFLRLESESLLGSRYQNRPSSCLQQFKLGVLQTRTRISNTGSSDNDGKLTALWGVQDLGSITNVRLSASSTSAVSANMSLVGKSFEQRCTMAPKRLCLLIYILVLVFV
jgi:hypothetical protein